MIRVGIDSISIGIAALTMGLALHARGPDVAHLFSTGSKSDRLDISISGTNARNKSDFRILVGSRVPNGPDMRVASLETGVASEGAIDGEGGQSNANASSMGGALFQERLLSEEDRASFDERFGVTGVSPDRVDAASAETEQRAERDLPAPAATERQTPRAVTREPRSGARPAETAARPDGRSAPKLAMLTSPPPASASKGRPDPEGGKDWSSQPEIDSRTAIYDIAAHAVYLPNGKRLEAHSGLGSHLDDPRSIREKSRGPTPPNVYRLALRERLFHGVRAIRLIPQDDTKMFGRDGMLAHSYMLGPNGQSNGCVSFSDYPAFLNAFLNGDVERLVVVERLASAPTAKAGSGWLADAIGDIFKPVDRAPDHAGADDHYSAFSYQ